MNNTIIEGNERIALFDGWIISRDQDQVYLHARIYSRLNNLINKEGCIYLEEAKYHSDWNWLMSAWKKWSELPVSEKHFNMYVNLSANIRNAIATNQLEESFNRLVSAIDWYNSLNNKDNE